MVFETYYSLSAFISRHMLRSLKSVGSIFVTTNASIKQQRLLELCI